MYRTVTRKKYENDMGMTPRPVLAIFFRLKTEDQGTLLPIGQYHHQVIPLIMSALPFRDPGTRLAISVQDNTNDKIKDVLLLPPLVKENHAVVVDHKPFSTVTVELQQMLVKRVRRMGEDGKRFCDATDGYSKEKVFRIPCY
jgi:hypothetical protein